MTDEEKRPVSENAEGITLGTQSDLCHHYEITDENFEKEINRIHSEIIRKDRAKE